jgi:caffeoyl-CoA O-methyltransferase
MSDSIYITHPLIEAYCRDHTTPPSPTHQELIPATQIFAPQAAGMQVGPIEGKFLSLITALMNAKNVLEFGTFTGYSALAFAESLPDQGKVTTLDRDPKATEFARKYWDSSGQGKKIELILGNAQETVLKLAEEIKNGSRPQFDIAFIDADKGGYPQYWEAALKLVRKGGAILVDNVLWSGGVVEPEEKSDYAMQEFNTRVFKDSRVEKVILPIRDGIYLARIL